MVNSESQQSSAEHEPKPRARTGVGDFLDLLGFVSRVNTAHEEKSSPKRSLARNRKRRHQHSESFIVEPVPSEQSEPPEPNEANTNNRASLDAHSNGQSSINEIDEDHLSIGDLSSDASAAQHHIETIAFEALLHDISDDRVTSLLHILGWPEQFTCFAIAGTPASSFTTTRQTILRKVQDLGGSNVLIGSYRKTCIALIVIQSAVSPEITCTAVNHAFSEKKPLCLGPVRRNTAGAARAILGVVSGLKSAPAMQTLPRPMRADDVLPERALLGDADARDELYTNVYESLLSDNADDPTLITVSTFIHNGSSLDTTARELNVHPNTVRYRLKRAADTTGWDATNPREAYILQTAIALGRIRDAER